MMQGIQSNYETYSTINSITTNNITKTTNTEVEVIDGKVSKTDKVEISTEGKLANETATQSSPSEIQNLLAETELSSATSTDIAELAKSAPTSVPASAPTDGTEETETTETATILTTLTESQLDDLVDEGTITQAEKNSEMARREAAKLETNSDESIEEDTEKDVKLKTSSVYEQDIQ